MSTLSEYMRQMAGRRPEDNATLSRVMAKSGGSPARPTGMSRAMEQAAANPPAEMAEAPRFGTAADAATGANYSYMPQNAAPQSGAAPVSAAQLPTDLTYSYNATGSESLPTDLSYSYTPPEAAPQPAYTGWRAPALSPETNPTRGMTTPPPGSLYGAKGRPDTPNQRTADAIYEKLGGMVGGDDKMRILENAHAAGIAWTPAERGFNPANEIAEQYALGNFGGAGIALNPDGSGYEAMLADQQGLYGDAAAGAFHAGATAQQPQYADIYNSAASGMGLYEPPPVYRSGRRRSGGGEDLPGYDPGKPSYAPTAGVRATPPVVNGNIDYGYTARPYAPSPAELVVDLFEAGSPGAANKLQESLSDKEKEEVSRIVVERGY